MNVSKGSDMGSDVGAIAGAGGVAARGGTNPSDGSKVIVHGALLVRARTDTVGGKLAIKIASRDLCPEGTVRGVGVLTTEDGVGFAKGFCKGVRKTVAFGAALFSLATGCMSAF